MKPIIVVTPIDEMFAAFGSRGLANGYVIVDKDHPWFEKHYDDIDCQIHGGLTFSSSVEMFGRKLWQVGFDTAHCYDSVEKWPIEKVFKEAMDLYNQALLIKTNL